MPRAVDGCRVMMNIMLTMMMVVVAVIIMMIVMMIVAPSPTMRNRTKSFRDILLFIVDQNVLSVGVGLRSHPSLHKHRKNCEKEIMLNIMDNMQ